MFDIGRKRPRTNLIDHMFVTSGKVKGGGVAGNRNHKLIVVDFKGRSKAQAPENKIIDHMFLTSGRSRQGQREIK